MGDAEHPARWCRKTRLQDDPDASAHRVGQREHRRWSFLPMWRTRGSSISARRPSRAVALPVFGVHPTLALSTWGHVGPPPRVARERPLAPGSFTRVSPPHDSDHRAPSLLPVNPATPSTQVVAKVTPGGSSPEAPHEDRSKVSAPRTAPHLRLPLQPAPTCGSSTTRTRPPCAPWAPCPPRSRRSWAPRSGSPRL